MQVTTKPLTPQFTPFDLTLKVETEQDAQRLYFIFNYTPIVEGAEIDSVAAVARDEITKHAKRSYDRFTELKSKFTTAFRRCNS